MAAEDTLSPQPRVMPAVLASVLLHALVVLLLVWRPDFPEAEQTETVVAVELIAERPAPPKPAPKPEPEPSPKPVPEAPKPIPDLKPAEPVATRKAAIAPVQAKPTQSERDRVLAQVLRQWKPPPELIAFEDAEFEVRVTVLADGTLAAPFSHHAPFDPGAAIDGWNALHPDDPARRGSESFYRALRMAQPLRLSPELAAKAPFAVVLDFRVRDVR